MHTAQKVMWHFAVLIFKVFVQNHFAAPFKNEAFLKSRLPDSSHHYSFISIEVYSYFCTSAHTWL